MGSGRKNRDRGRQGRAVPLRRVGGPGGAATGAPRIGRLFPPVYALVFLLAGLAVHGAFFPVGDIAVESDFYSDLVVAAQKLWNGEPSVADYEYKGPLYSLALVAVRFFVRDWYWSGIVLNLLCAAAGLVLVHGFVSRLFGGRTAAFTMVAVSVVTEFFVLSHKASSDMLFFMLCMLTIDLLLRERRGPLHAAAAGAAGACAFLTRYIGVFLPLSGLIVLLLVDPWRRPARARMIPAVLFLAAFLVVTAPWFALNLADTGVLLHTRNVENVGTEFYGPGRPVFIPHGAFDSVLDIAARDPSYFIGHYLSNIPGHFWRDMRETLAPPAAVLVVLGLSWCLLVPPTRMQLAFHVFPLAYLSLIALVFHLPRFSLPLLPAYYAIAFSFLFGAGASRRTRLGNALARFAPGPRVWGWAAAAAIIFLAGFQAAGIVAEERRYYGARPLFVLEAGEFLRRPSVREGLDPRPLLMARKAHLAYYADMRFTFYPARIDDIYHLFGAIIGRGVDFVAYTAIEELYFKNTPFHEWLASTPGVDPVYRKENNSVYRVSPWLSLDREEGREEVAQKLRLLSEADAAGDADRSIEICYHLSILHLFNRRWEEAAGFASTGLATIERNPLLQRRADMLRYNLSYAYLHLGRSAEGIELVRIIIRNFEQAGYVTMIANLHVFLARHYEELGRRDEAIASLRTARGIFSSNDMSSMAEDMDQRIRQLELGI